MQFLCPKDQEHCPYVKNKVKEKPRNSWWWAVPSRMPLLLVFILPLGLVQLDLVPGKPVVGRGTAARL